MITVNAEPMEWEDGITVQDIIERKKYTFPLLAVWINDIPVPREEFDSTTVPDGAKVQVIHMISGG
jgi:sulfur carrier protein